MPEIESLPDLNEAMDRLAAAEAAETSTEPAPKPISEQVDTPSDTQPPTDSKDGSTPNSLPTDTPAAAEPKKEPAEPQKNKTTEIQGEAKSKYAKDRERLDKTWENANKRKAEIEAKEQALIQRENQIKQQEERFEQKRVKASAKYTPEQYDQAGQQMAERAQSYELQAKGLEKEAEELESDGKYAEAESRKARARELREASIGQKIKAKDAADYAKHLRDNPDPTEQQVKAKMEEQKKEWTMKAATQWPAFAKEGGEFQQTVVGHLKALEKDAPELLEFPGIIYHVARLTAAELENKSYAARVPGLEKKLGEATARVKELEAFTAPGGGNSATQKVSTDRQPQSDEEERESLRQMALQRS